MGDIKGKVFSLNLSKTRGTAKNPMEQVKIIENYGLEGDVHAGEKIKQVSLLDIESIKNQKTCPKIKTGLSLKPGDFAENITTENINLAKLKIGDKLNVGKEVILEISQIGKECHKYCAIYYRIGDCIMPRQGVFARVLKGGTVNIGDEIRL